MLDGHKKCCIPTWKKVINSDFDGLNREQSHSSLPVSVLGSPNQWEIYTGVEWYFGNFSDYVKQRY